MTDYRLVAEPRADLDIAAAYQWYEREQLGLVRPRRPSREPRSGGVAAPRKSLGVTMFTAVVFAGPTAEFRRQEAELKGRYLSV